MKKYFFKLYTFYTFFGSSCKTLKPLLKKALRECQASFRILLPKSMTLQSI